MNVKQLSKEQLSELKSAYFWGEDTQDKVPEGCDFPDDIPDEVVLKHYDGIEFVQDDFFCTAGKED